MSTPAIKASAATGPRPRIKRPASVRVIRWVIKPVIWVAALTPLALLVKGWFTGGLGANPVEKMTHWTGFTAITLLTITLAITPIRRITGWHPVIKVRRLIGLLAFFYVSIHLFIWMLFDHQFKPDRVIPDILERPYITVGFTAFLLLVPLAATSTKASIRRLGRKWQKLHYLIYPAGLLAVLHFYWKEAAKADTRDSRIFAAIVGVLLVSRLVFAFRERRKRRLRKSAS